MPNFIVTSYDEFKQIIKNNQDTDHLYVEVNDGLNDNIFKIVDYYNGILAFQKNNNKRFSLRININIFCKNDYKRLLQIYYDRLSNQDFFIFKNVEFLFNIWFANGESALLLWIFQNDISPLFSNRVKKCIVKAHQIQNASDLIKIDPRMREFQNLIRKNTNIFLNHENNYFLLNIDVTDNEIFDLNKLHNNLLICCKYKSFCKGFVINIRGDINRIKPYVQNILSAKIIIICNQFVLEPDLNSVGKIPPAIYFNNIDYLFFKEPLPQNLWKKIKSEHIINLDSLKQTSSFIYWPYLRICQKFLFEEFDNNSSKEYTHLRKKAYSSESFYKNYVSKMSFLSLCLFAIYDNFYRSDLLKQAKNYYKKNNLKLEDILLSEQKNQSWHYYIRYEKNLKEYDIKNLFSFDENSELHQTVISEIFECVSISEGLLQIMENAVKHANGGLLSMRIYSLDTGLKTGKLQKEHHVEYLYNTYSKEYFEYNNARFYLEIHISDLSNLSIPQKFLENTLNNDALFFKEINEKCNQDFNTSIDFEKIFDNKQESMNFFFNKNYCNLELNYLRRYFYEKPENLVNHYGLEIFTNILTVRNGLFGVCGYDGYHYDNLKPIFEKIYNHDLIKINNLSNNLNQEIKNQIVWQRDLKENMVRKNLYANDKISGTNYSILFPLMHSPIKKNEINSINDIKESFGYFSTTDRIKPLIITPEDFNKAIIEKSISCSKKNNLIPPRKQESYENTIKIAQRLNLIIKNENVIYTICDDGDSKGDDNDKSDQKVVCINFNNWDSIIERSYTFEQIIKGTLLFALKTVDEEIHTEKNSIRILPIALVNLTSFQLIEASRIIAIYYAKELRTKNNDFNKIQLYLKGKENCKELVFFGKDIEDVKQNIIKTAMINGTVFKELSTIIEIFRKEAKE